VTQAVAVARRDGAQWAQALKGEDGFRREQAEIGKIWQLVGFSTDLQHDGDWFRGTLGGRSIFVQRFKDELRGFENVCVHRGFPLRTEDRGHGAIRCGFHHWQYDKEGCAVGIPKCKELFGKTPRELDARLRPLDVATCGSLVFARFPSEEHRETLEAYLGPGFEIVKSMWTLSRPPKIRTIELKANWRLGHHISLDDYHLVAVHPKTLGKNGYLSSDVVKYYRFGRHSAYFYGADEQALLRMADECRNGTYRPHDYRILQFFPNLVVVPIKAIGNTYALIQQYVPIAHDRTLLLSIFHEAPFPTPDSNAAKAFARRLAMPLARVLVPMFVHKVALEDNVVCERMQSVARQLDTPQILGRQEQRIGWFEENYAEVVGEL